MKNGFMLIELIVATLIASMIGGLLLTALSQATRFQQSVDIMVDTTLRIGIASKQIEKDFMGAFIPTQARLKEDKDDEDEESSDKSKTADAEKKKPEKEKKSAENEEKETKKSQVKKPAEKPLEKIFYGTTKDNHLDILTFITNNPLVVFVGKDVGAVKPKIARVQYTLKLENEKERKDVFVLMRQESMELDAAQIGAARSYELIDGIKECTVTYTARIKKEDEKAKKVAPAQTEKNAKEKAQPEKTAATEKPKVEYEYKVLKEWVSEQPKQEGPKEKAQEEGKEFPRIPYMIEIKLVLWNKQRTKTDDFVLVYQLPIDISVEKKEEKEKDAGKAKKKEDEESGGNKEGAGKEVALNDATSNDKKDNLVNTLSATLGNITKIFNAM